MIKKTLFFAGIIIWGAIAFLAYANQDLSLNINFIKGSLSLGFPVFAEIFAILSALATGLILQANISNLESKIKQQNRKNEKASIVKEEAQDRVKLLENKIKTLEKALEEALKRK